MFTQEVTEALGLSLIHIFIPAFTLQPIVENAIIHGLSKKEQGGKILLKIWKEGNKVIISVADTGVGMLSLIHIYIVSELSQGMTLTAGTISATGTPAGVGMGFNPPRFLKPGDVVECTIEGIGTIANKVMD